MNSYCQLKGISATGKGTRVSQLLMFLINKFDYQYVTDELETRKNGTVKRVVGIYVPEVNVMIQGHWVRSFKAGRMYSWTGLDTLNSGCTYEEIMKLITKWAHTNFICEGYVMTFGAQYQIPKIKKQTGHHNFFFKYLVYPTDEGFELLQDRIVGRSAKRIKGTCWKQNSTCISDYKHHMEEIPNIPDLGSVKILKDDYNEAHWKFGAQYLDFIGRKDLVTEFYQYSVDHPTLRHVEHADSNHAVFAQYYEEQKNFLVKGVEPQSGALKGKEGDSPPPQTGDGIMAEFDKVMKRVKNLLDMAADKSSPNEAAIATRRAAMLMEKYNIEMADVIEQDLASSDQNVVDEFMSDRVYKRRWPRWIQSLVVLTTRTFETHVRYENAQNDEGEWGTKMKLFGFRPDVQISKYIINYVMNTFIDMSEAEWRKCQEKYAALGAKPPITAVKFKNSWYAGAIDGIRKELDAHKPAKPVVTSSGTELVLVKDAAIVEKFGEFKYGKSSARYDVDRNAYANGYEKGSKVKINKALEEKNAA